MLSTQLRSLHCRLITHKSLSLVDFPPLPGSKASHTFMERLAAYCDTLRITIGVYLEDLSRPKSFLVLDFFFFSDDDWLGWVELLSMDEAILGLDAEDAREARAS